MILLGGKRVVTEQFANNETKVKDWFEKQLKPKGNILELKYESDADIVLMIFCKHRIDELGYPASLFVWYMPYSRMDRKMEDDLYTLPSICKIINWLKFEKVVVLDRHSEKTMELLDDNAEDVYVAPEWLPKVMSDIGFSKNDCLVLPDNGAKERYSNIQCDNICIFDKDRDPITRELTKMELIEGTVPKGAKCIILDDICGKGTTSLKGASILKSLGASRIVLVVSHCEETAFNGTLFSASSPIERVYTSKSLMRRRHKKLQYMKVDVNSYFK